MTLFGQEHIDRYVATDGEEGHDWQGTQTLILTTTGRRSGQPRRHALIYGRHGDDYLVVASKGGDPKSPGWYHNLKANPNIEINVGPKRFAVTASPVLPDNPDYARMWHIVNTNNANRYIAYQKKTSRPIPVVVLTPKA